MASKWREVSVAEIASPSRNALVGGPFGSDLVSRDYEPGGVPVIRGQNMGGRWVSGEFVYVSYEKAKALEANLTKPGDIVFTQRGTLGQVCLVPPKPFASYLISQSQMKLTVNPSIADPVFYYYMFSTAEQREYVRQNAIQTGVPHTNLGILRSTPVPLPPLVEQHAIARILGTLDDKIELNQRMNATLEETMLALFRSWFVDFDPVRAKAAGRPSELRLDSVGLFPDALAPSSLGDLPIGWNVSLVDDLADVSGGSTPSTTNAAYWDEGIHPWATPKDLSFLSSPILLETERKLTDFGLQQIGSGLRPKGTVLLSSRAPIGYLAVAETDVSVNQGLIAMVPKRGVSNLFLLCWTRLGHETILSRSNGSTFLEISKTNFRSIPVVSPPAAVHSAFDRLARPMYERMLVNVRETAALTAVRDALLPRLMSCAIRLSV